MVPNASKWGPGTSYCPGKGMGYLTEVFIASEYYYSMHFSTDFDEKMLETGVQLVHFFVISKPIGLWIASKLNHKASYDVRLWPHPEIAVSGSVQYHFCSIHRILKIE